MAKRNSICTKDPDPNAGTVTFKFADDTQLFFDLADVPEGSDADKALPVHGASQKIGDSYAGAESVAEAKIAATEQIALLVAGEWKAARAAGEPKIGLLIEALARVKPDKTLDECRGVVESMDADGKKVLRDDRRIKAAIDAIKAERSAALVDKSTGGVDFDVLMP